MTPYTTPTGIKCGSMLPYKLPELDWYQSKLQDLLLPNYLKQAKERVKRG